MPPQSSNPTTVPESPAPQDVRNPLAVMQPGEQVIFELKRHPIGIMVTYIMTAIVVFALAIIVLVVGPSLTTGNADQVRTWGVVGLFIFIVLSLIFNLIATVVYWGNRWILTDDSITQITQTSLFHKETSQLGLESLEDVTAEKRGILPHIFNYGVLKAETAGHRSKFVFLFAPNPNYYAQKILDAHEKENLENRPYYSHANPPQYSGQRSPAPPDSSSPPSPLPPTMPGPPMQPPPGPGR